MSELSEEAVKLINEQIEVSSKQYEKTLRELDFYKWVGRIAFVVILGGSIFGIFTTQDYVDDRVAKRVEKQDSLYAGAVLTTAWGDLFLPPLPGQYRIEVVPAPESAPAATSAVP